MRSRSLDNWELIAHRLVEKTKWSSRNSARLLQLSRTNLLSSYRGGDLQTNHTVTSRSADVFALVLMVNTDNGGERC